MANPYPQNLSQAVSASRNNNLSFLNNVGTTQAAFEPTITTMERVAGDFITKVKNNLTTGNYQVTGDIANIVVDVIDSETLHIVVPVQLLVLNYGIAGVYSNAKAPQSPFSYHNGVLPPLLPFLEWQRFRQLTPRKPDGMSQDKFDSLTKDEKDQMVAYAVKTGIYKEGRKPVDVFTSELPDLEQELLDELTKHAISNMLGQLPLSIGVPAAYNAQGQIPLTGVPIPGLLTSNRP
jgi:hypothetical protein